MSIDITQGHNLSVTSFPPYSINFNMGADSLCSMFKDLGNYLTEKSFSPDVSFVLKTIDIRNKPNCCNLVIRFWAPNVRKDYVREIIVPGVDSWNFNNMRRDIECKPYRGGVYVVVPLTINEWDSLTSASEPIRLCVAEIYPVDALRSILDKFEDLRKVPAVDLGGALMVYPDNSHFTSDSSNELILTQSSTVIDSSGYLSIDLNNPSGTIVSGTSE